MDVTKITINKNRGWRGLAEVDCSNDTEDVMKMIFSFSQDVWNDMLKGVIVLQDHDNYIVLKFDNLDKLPKPTQQRSVLIKHFTANVAEVVLVPKDNWMSTTMGTSYYNYIYHFIKNRNNHTTSDWNYIGIRVMPMI